MYVEPGTTSAGRTAKFVCVRRYSEGSPRRSHRTDGYLTPRDSAQCCGQVDPRIRDQRLAPQRRPGRADSADLGLFGCVGASTSIGVSMRSLRVS